jgi:hypothetical protein
MTRDGHNGLFASLGLGQFGYGVMAEIVKTQPGHGTLDLVNIRTAP